MKFICDDSRSGKALLFGSNLIFVSNVFNPVFLGEVRTRTEIYSDVLNEVKSKSPYRPTSENISKRERFTHRYPTDDSGAHVSCSLYRAR